MSTRDLRAPSAIAVKLCQNVIIESVFNFIIQVQKFGWPSTKKIRGLKRCKIRGDFKQIQDLIANIMYEFIAFKKNPMACNLHVTAIYIMLVSRLHDDQAYTHSFSYLYLLCFCLIDN